MLQFYLELAHIRIKLYNDPYFALYRIIGSFPGADVVMLNLTFGISSPHEFLVLVSCNT